MRRSLFVAKNGFKVVEVKTIAGQAHYIPSHRVTCCGCGNEAIEVKENNGYCDCCKVEVADGKKHIFP